MKKFLILLAVAAFFGTPAFAADGDLTVNGNLVTNGTTTLHGVKVTAPSFYVITGACPPGDTAVSYRTAPNTCGASWVIDPCGNDPACPSTVSGSCTTGSHGWGSSTTHETCSYACGGCDPTYSPQNCTYCTCYAQAMILCNPGQ